MSNYSWSQFNQKNIRLANEMIKYNKKFKINYFEKGLYNHIRDIFALSILKIRKKNNLNILDYGSNLASLANLSSKINLNRIKFNIYDPFAKKKIHKYKKFKLTIFNSTLKNNFFDLIHFGSSIQYINKLVEIDNVINFKKTKLIVITNTPISLKNKYQCAQSNHAGLTQYIHNISEIKKFFLKKKFNLIFKSRNDDKFVACKKKQKETFSLNLIFERI